MSWWTTGGGPRRSDGANCTQGRWKPRPLHRWHHSAAGCCVNHEFNKWYMMVHKETSEWTWTVCFSSGFHPQSIIHNQQLQQAVTWRRFYYDTLLFCCSSTEDDDVTARWRFIMIHFSYLMSLGSWLSLNKAVRCDTNKLSENNLMTHRSFQCEIDDYSRNRGAQVPHMKTNTNLSTRLFISQQIHV